MSLVLINKTLYWFANVIDVVFTMARSGLLLLTTFVWLGQYSLLPARALYVMGFGGGTLLRLRLLAFTFKAIFRGMALLAAKFTLFSRIIIVIIIVMIELTLCR